MALKFATRRVLGNYSNYLFMTGSSKILFTRFFYDKHKEETYKDTKNQGESLFLNRFLLSGKSQIIKLGDKRRKLLFVLLVFPSLMAPLLPLSFFNKKRSLLKNNESNYNKRASSLKIFLISEISESNRQTSSVY